MTYDGLLETAYCEGLIVKEKPLKANRGKIKADKIAISTQVKTTAEKTCILAEELGHYYTSYGDITDLNAVANRKQERRARAWGYESIIPPIRFIDAFKYGCSGPHETAAFFEVTEEFLHDSLMYYKEKYGTCLVIGRHAVYFDPVGIVEMFA